MISRLRKSISRSGKAIFGKRGSFVKKITQEYEIEHWFFNVDYRSGIS